MTKRHKICHLSSVHPKDDIRIFQKECRSLAAAGFDVSLIVPDAGPDTTIDGVKIKTLPLVAGRLKRMLITPLRVFAAAVRLDCEVYHFHDPELLPVGILLKMCGRRVIYDAHEDVPADILSKAYIPAVLRRIIAGCVRMVEFVAAKLLDRIVTATPAIARKFPPKKAVPIQNFPILGELQSAPDAALAYPRRARKIIYVGAITRIRGAREMVAAMSLVRSTPPVTLVLAGRIQDDALRQELEGLPGWRHVDYRGLLSRPKVAEAMSECRAGLVLFHPGPNHDEAQPNKLFEYMSARLPLLASNFPLWRELIEKENCGVVVDPQQPQSIADGIDRIIADEAASDAMAGRGLRATQVSYNWEAEVPKLVRIYADLMNSAKAGV